MKVEMGTLHFIMRRRENWKAYRKEGLYLNHQLFKAESVCVWGGDGGGIQVEGHLSVKTGNSESFTELCWKNFDIS